MSPSAEFGILKGGFTGCSFSVKLWKLMIKSQNGQAKNTAGGCPQPGLQWQGGHWVSKQLRGRGAGAQCLPGQSTARTPQAWVVGFLFLAALPGGPSAALYPQAGLSADYDEDPEPAKGRQAQHLTVTD